MWKCHPKKNHTGWHSLHRLCCEATRSRSVHVELSWHTDSWKTAFPRASCACGTLPRCGSATQKRITPGGTACIGCVAKQQEAEDCTLNSNSMLDPGRECSLRLLVPAAHSHTVEVPPKDESHRVAQPEQAVLQSNKKQRFACSIFIAC